MPHTQIKQSEYNINKPNQNKRNTNQPNHKSNKPKKKKKPHEPTTMTTTRTQHWCDLTTHNGDARLATSSIAQKLIWFLVLVRLMCECF